MNLLKEYMDLTSVKVRALEKERVDPLTCLSDPWNG